jgi:hypothetical protein
MWGEAPLVSAEARRDEGREQRGHNSGVTEQDVR